METISTQELDVLLTAMIHSAEGISDLLFVADRPPQMEIHGKIKPFGADASAVVLTSARIESLARAIINGNPRLLEDLAKSGSCDCSYSLPELCRFRVNIYRQNGNFAMVLRRLQSQIPSMDALHLPPVFRDVVKEKNGLIFVTGGTGSGKTTTLAALLNEVKAVAQEVNASVAQVGLAWLLAKGVQRGQAVIPIPGTTNPQHLEENLAAADCVLNTEQLARLETALAPERIVGGRYNALNQSEVDTEEYTERQRP